MAVVAFAPLPISMKRLTALMSVERVTMLLEKTRSIAMMLRTRMALSEIKTSVMESVWFADPGQKQEKKHVQARGGSIMGKVTGLMYYSGGSMLGLWHANQIRIVAIVASWWLEKEK